MKTRRSTPTRSPKAVFGLGSAAVAAIVLSLLPDPAAAKTRAESVSYGICEILLQDPPDEQMLAQIRARADFADILAFVEGNCRGGGDLLVGPTATIPTPRDNRNGGNPRLPTPGGGGAPVDPGKGGEDPKEDPPKEPEDPPEGCIAAPKC